VLSTYLKQPVPFDDAVPGAAIAVHTFGDFQQFNPHLHLIAPDGCFSGSGMFSKGPEPVAKDLDPMNHNDGYGFALMQVNCCQKTEKLPSFFLSLQVCSKSSNTLISDLYARRAQPDRTYCMLYVLSG
jgi:hypothetical protein